MSSVFKVREVCDEIATNCLNTWAQLETYLHENVCKVTNSVL